MKVLFKNLVLITITFILLYACDKSTDPADIVKISGTVYAYNVDDNIVPIENALVSAKNIFLQKLTDQNGEYSFEFEPDTDTLNVKLSVSKIGFQTANTSVSVKKGKDFVVPAIPLLLSTDDTTDIGITESGDAAHIQIVTPSEDHIYVYSSGLKETAALVFRVTDSEGLLVDNNHVATVKFNILNGPDGGEYLSPLEALTTDGYVATTLNSGTIAGAVQIEAYIEGENKIIRSTPTRIAIYGGLPDQEHFSIAAAKVNIAGQVRFGLLDNITAFVGDKYSNPVAPGTVVYFSTEYGIVEGAAITDELGRATVRYMSAAPLPPNPASSSFTLVTAWTYGDTLTNLTLSSDVSILLSSVTSSIQVDPLSFEYDNSNSPVSFDFVVADIYGNPLVSDTDISVSASAGELIGETNIKTTDTRFPGRGSTDFSFTWFPGDSLEATAVYISIKASPPPDGNGYSATSVSGTKVVEVP